MEFSSINFLIEHKNEHCDKINKIRYTNCCRRCICDDDETSGEYCEISSNVTKATNSGSVRESCLPPVVAFAWVLFLAISY